MHFTILVRYIGFAILNFGNLTFDSKSATHKTLRYQVWSNQLSFYNLSSPYWIRYFEFWKFDFGFEISDSKNPQILSFVQISLHSTILVRYFEFWKFDFGFEIRDSKNPQILSFVQISLHSRILVRHFDFENLTSDSKSATRKTLRSQVSFKSACILQFWFAILDPSFWILEIRLVIQNQQPQ